MNEPSTQLIHFDAARRSLEMAASIDEVKVIRDKAARLQEYVRQQGATLEMQNQCAEIKIRAERKAGEMLEVMDRQGPTRPKEKVSHDETLFTPKLSDFGISRSSSSRWQSVAAIPEEEFEQHIADTKAARKELTSKGVQTLAKTLKKEKKLKMFAENNSSTQAVKKLQDLIDSGQKFKTIYADPPWQYGNQGTRASTNNHYTTMSVDEIADLPIAQLADEEAHLHLWTTNAFLFDAKKIIESWGFEYKSVFVWIKPQMGIGNYWRVSHEFLLLGVRGGLTFKNRGQMSWVSADRQKHSVKPDKIRQIVETVSFPSYLELFGRQQTPNWTVWGNEIEESLLPQMFQED